MRLWVEWEEPVFMLPSISWNGARAVRRGCNCLSMFGTDESHASAPVEMMTEGNASTVVDTANRWRMSYFDRTLWVESRVVYVSFHRLQYSHIHTRAWTVTEILRRMNSRNNLGLKIGSFEEAPRLWAVQVIHVACRAEEQMETNDTEQQITGRGLRADADMRSIPARFLIRVDSVCLAAVVRAHKRTLGFWPVVVPGSSIRSTTLSCQVTAR